MIIQLIDEQRYRYVPSSPVSEDFFRGGVDEDDRKADGEDPDCLVDPKNGEPKRLRPLVVETTVLTFGSLHILSVNQ